MHQRVQNAVALTVVMQNELQRVISLGTLGPRPTFELS